MGTNNVLLLRVGIDSNTGRGHAPLFEDNTFEYVPIPENSDTSETRTYADLTARTSGKLSRHVPHLSDEVPHFDPEFEMFTYGDPGKNKRSQLARLTTDDLLIFYCSLAPKDVEVGPRLCVIGYFVVDQAYDLSDMTPEERADVFEALRNNAHVKREGLTPDSPHRERFPVVVRGQPEESRLLEEPIPLGGEDRTVLPWVADVTGFDGDLTRAGVARVLDEDNADEIRDWLDRGSRYLVHDGASLRSYVVATDSGFAPNVTGGYCTLATCKSRIRDHAYVGDWVLGTPSKSRGEEKITYLMRVEETMTFDEYYHDDRFEMKKPENDPDGDNIYYREDDVLVQDGGTNHHTNADDRHRDLKTDRVLISSTFWYFGDGGVTIPESLRDEVIHQYDSSHRRLYSKKRHEALCELISWCSLRFDLGTYGRPSGGGNQRNCC